MHLAVALDGPVAFSHPNPINQPKPGSQEQLQVLPSHHLRAQLLSGRNLRGKEFSHFPQRALRRELGFCLVFFDRKGQRIFWSWTWSRMIGGEGKTGWKQVFFGYWLKYCQHSPPDENFRSKASQGWVWSCLWVLLCLHGLFFFKASKFSTFPLLTRAIFWGCIYNKKPNDSSNKVLS